MMLPSIFDGTLLFVYASMMNTQTHHHNHGSLNKMAASATLHCLTGCAIGEVSGLIIGTALGWTMVATMALAIGLAFVFGFALSALPLVRVGMSVPAALSIVIPADVLSITVMEIVDNTVMALIPGAMHAGLANPVFWLAMILALAAAYVAAYPVNRYLLTRGRGHALIMKHLGAHHHDHHSS